MNRKVANMIKDVDLGDLIRVEWFDASIGRSLATGTRVDIPVRSWGIFIAVLGEKSKHIILAQNSFKYTDGVYDVDYTSIPISWAANVVLVNKAEVDREVAERLFQSFLAGRCRTIKKRTKNHAEMDQEGIDKKSAC